MAGVYKHRAPNFFTAAPNARGCEIWILLRVILPVARGFWEICTTWYTGTSVSEELVASIFRLV